MIFGFTSHLSYAADSHNVVQIAWDEDNFHKGSNFFAKKIQVNDFDMNQNQNKNFYEPNAISEMGYFLPTTTTIDNPKGVKCKGCSCTVFLPEKKNGFGNDN